MILSEARGLWLFLVIRGRPVEFQFAVYAVYSKTITQTAEVKATIKLTISSQSNLGIDRLWAMVEH